MAPAGGTVTGAGRAVEHPAAGRSVELRGIGRSFASERGPVEAVAGFDLAAAPGELVSVIGPSGCGKSTVFNIVAGLDQPTAGEVRIGGTRVDDRLGASAYMPQRDALLPWRRVIDNVTLPLRLAGRSRGEARAKARPLLDRFGLGAFADAWPWQLSGGMRHRVAFLRTVVTEPTLMLLDEPFGSLDSITRADLQEWLGAVWAEVGSTVLLVTHDVTEAVALSDRIAVVTPRPGRVAEVVDVGLPRPRLLADREDPAFTAVERRVRAALRSAMWQAGS